MTTTCIWCGYGPMSFAEGQLFQCFNCGNKLSTSRNRDDSRTQKGIGWVALQEVYPGRVLEINQIATEENHLSNLSYPLFARPAPSKPRHGYIDSRVVKSVEEASALLKQVLADDPEGEVIFCPFLKSTWNMIWTPGSLVVGPGHDGATAGKRTITIPLAGVMPKEFTPEFLTCCRIGSEEWPFVEAVWHKQLAHYMSQAAVLTQLRAGPKVSFGGDYIPHSVEVEEVVHADQTMFKDRDWEVLVGSLSGKEGVVIWHPNGARTDHFSIHAFTHRIPILYGKNPPKIGDFLEQLEGQKEETFDPLAMLRGLQVGDRFKLISSGNRHNTDSAVSFLLLALHNVTALTGAESKWIGLAAALMLRLGTTALTGESRHLPRPETKPSRSTVYEKVFQFNLTRQRSRVNSLVNIFRYGYWPSSGYGGPKWANCGGALVGLFEAVRILARDSSPDSAAGVVRALNVAVNQAHNGGWWLNKFENQEAFKQIQAAHIPWILNATPVVYIGGMLMNRVKEADLEAFIKRVACWKETTLQPPKVVSMELTYILGTDTAQVVIYSRLLRKSGKALTIPIGEAVKGLTPNTLTQKTYVIGTSDGYRIEVRPRNKERLIVWQDASLAEEAAKMNGF